MNSLTKLFCLFFFLFAIISCQSNKNEKENQLPNIVLILADDLGFGDPQSYNTDSKVPTPNIDKLAKEGIRFTDAHTPSSVCTPTRYGLLTGRYCWRTELKSGVLGGYDFPLIKENRETLGDICKNAGYNTAVIGKWHLGLPWQLKEELEGDSVVSKRSGFDKNSDIVDLLKPLGKGGPNDLGFDYSYIIPSSLDIVPYVYLENKSAVELPTDSVVGMNRSKEYDEGFWRGGPASPGFDHQNVLPHLTEKAIQFITKQSAEKPFFLYFPITAPHTPWVPTEEFRGKSQAGKYGDFVAMVDDVVGQVLKTLEEKGFSENTMVIFTSDNGSHIAHIGKEYNHKANADWRGQKADVYEGGHRVPLVMKWPGKIAPSTSTDQVACLTDIFATFKSILGEETEAEFGEDSYTLLTTLLQKKNDNAREIIVHHSLDGMFSVRKGDWKLNFGRGSGGFTAPRRIEISEGEPMGELYNLQLDPAEENNVYADHPEIVKEFSDLLEKYKSTGRSN